MPVMVHTRLKNREIIFRIEAYEKGMVKFRIEAYEKGMVKNCSAVRTCC